MSRRFRNDEAPSSKGFKCGHCGQFEPECHEREEGFDHEFGFESDVYVYSDCCGESLKPMSKEEIWALEDELEQEQQQ